MGILNDVTPIGRFEDRRAIDKDARHFDFLTNFPLIHRNQYIAAVTLYKGKGEFGITTFPLTGDKFTTEYARGKNMGFYHLNADLPEFWRLFDTLK